MSSIAGLLLAASITAQQAPAPKRNPRTQPLTPADAVLTIPRVAGRVRLVADVDGDGVKDLAAPRGESMFAMGAIDFVSAKSGATIRTVWRGSAAYGMPWDAGGDANGDGVPDIVIGFPEHDGRRGRVLVIDGESDETPREVAGLSANDAFGASVAWMGDVDADCRDDIVVSATRFDPEVPFMEKRVVGWRGNGETNYVRFADGPEVEQRAYWQTRLAARSEKPGFVSARSGATGAELWRVEGEAHGHAFGEGLRVIPDLDGDESADILAWSDTRSDQPLLVLSGKTGEVVERIASRFGPAGCAGDLDRDGTPDLYLQRQGRGLGGFVAIDFVSGKTRKALFTIPPPDFWSDYTVVGALGDLDGDGIDDFALGDANFCLASPGDPGYEPGRAVDLGPLSLTQALALESAPWCAFTGETGCVLVYSGKSRSVLMGIWAPSGMRIDLGRDVAALPDVTGDGVADFLVGSYAQAYVFAGPGPSAELGARPDKK